MIIETSANLFYQVRDAGPDLSHCWMGLPVKRTKAGFVPKANAREMLVRKAGCKVVAQ